MLRNIILICWFTFLTFMLTACSSVGDWVKDTFEPTSPVDEVHEFHRPLEKQRLIPRPGFEGKLTNRVCLKFYGDLCEKESVREYDLNDEVTRNRLIDLQFACHVGGKRHRICPDKAGLCRREMEKVCTKWGRTIFKREKVCRNWKEEITEKFIPITDYQFLLDSRTECQKGL